MYKAIVLGNMAVLFFCCYGENKPQEGFPEKQEKEGTCERRMKDTVPKRKLEHLIS